MCPKCNEVYFYEKWRRRFDTQREDVKKERSEWCTTSQEVSDAIRSWNKQGSVITRASKGSSVLLLSRVQLFGPHRLQHARLPCISPVPKVYLNSCLSTELWHAILTLSQHQGLFQWVSSSRQMAKVLEFQLQHQSFQWTLGLISFRIDWLNVLAVQGTVKNLPQHHSSNASILWSSAFFIVQLSHTHMTTEKKLRFD